MTVKARLTVTKWTVHTNSVKLGLLTGFFETNTSSVNNRSALDNEQAAATLEQLIS